MFSLPNAEWRDIEFEFATQRASIIYGNSIMRGGRKNVMEWWLDDYALCNRIAADGYDSNMMTDKLFGWCTARAGSHRLKFTGYSTETSNINAFSISNLTIIDKYTEITLNEPGRLGEEILKQHDQVTEAKLIAIAGEMNETDCAQLKAAQPYIIDYSGVPIEDLTTDWAIGSDATILPEGLKSIGQNVFKNKVYCFLDIPSSVETIGSRAFESFKGRGSIYPEVVFATGSKLLSIGENAFSNSEIGKIILPDGVEEMGRYAFKGCQLLRIAHISDNLKTIPYMAFKDCYRLMEFNLPASLEVIEEEAFYQCGSWEHPEGGYRVEIPKNLRIVGTEAFRYSHLGGSLVFPHTMERIYAKAFYNNTELESVTIAGLRHPLSDGAFMECSNLKEVHIAAAYLPIQANPSYMPFHNTPRSYLEVPDFAGPDFKLDSYWSKFAKIAATKEMATRDKWTLWVGPNLDESHRLYGKPWVRLGYGAQMKIAGAEPQAYEYFQHNAGFAHKYSDYSSPNSYGTTGSYIYYGSGTSKESNCNELPAVYYALTEPGVVTAEKLDLTFRMHRNNWYFFSLPYDVKVSDIRHTDANAEWAIRYYDGASRASTNQASGNWKDVPADGTLKRGQGYIFMASVNGNLIFPAEKEQHPNFFDQPELTFALEENPCADNKANMGWNFVGNPYPTYFDIHDIGFEGPITIYDGAGYKALAPTDDEYALRPMEAFFIQCADGQTEAVMHSAGRQRNETIVRKAPRRAPSSSPRFLVDLSLTADAALTEMPDESDENQASEVEADRAADRTRVVLNEAAAADYEPARDAAKFFADSKDVPQLFTLDSEGNSLAINERPYGEGVVALGVVTPEKNAFYTISALRADRQVWLHDALTGLDHDLTAGDFRFLSDSEGMNATRFSLRFALDETGVETEGAQVEANITALRGAVMLTAAEGTAATIHGADGSIRFSDSLEGNSLRVELPAGVYVVRLGETVRKVNVK